MQTLLDLLFPPRCIFCGEASDASRICGVCRSELPWCGALEIKNGVLVTAPLYYEGLARNGVLRYKKQNVFQNDRALAALIAVCVRNHYLNKTVVPDLISYVGQNAVQRYRHGFNQSRNLALSLGKMLDIPVKPLLTKTLSLAKQSRSNAEQRRANASGAYSLKRGADVAGKCILLVDDVITTGSTVGACAEALKRAGADTVIAAGLAITKLRRTF
ncbi:MAG: double zinc ribbon domain-containing protein [Oscillospiraceae bacterium]|jgi:ComF family protein|nr:double zinc ribbon domain-containing protein [Oscillospiraceae bacterium]